MARVYPKRVYAYGGKLHRIAKVKHGSRSVTLSPDHPAATESRPLFPSTVVHASLSPRLLVSGFNARKIGGKVMKGRWAGMPIYTLTLAERTTCPSRCTQWLTCYGNNMHMARRHLLDTAFMIRLNGELDALATKHPAGFVVRPHVLGDFGADDNEPLALRYVELWSAALDRLPGLRVFGYTAHDPDEEVGSAILGMTLEHPDRCWIRFSGTADGRHGALVISDRAASQHVVCPAQTDATDCCATCGLCWTMDGPIEFLRH